MIRLCEILSVCFDTIIELCLLQERERKIVASIPEEVPEDYLTHQVIAVYPKDDRTLLFYLGGNE